MASDVDGADDHDGDDGVDGESLIFNLLMLLPRATGKSDKSRENSKVSGNRTPAFLIAEMRPPSAVAVPWEKQAWTSC